MMYYASTPVFLSTGDLTSDTCIYGYKGGLSETARKQVLWKGQKTGFSHFRRFAASISTEPFCPTEGGFSDQITSDRVQTILR